ncbi:MAG: bifunctional hydroxymethylpyrimidine kinase/phosphomethylpyrimidine kinase [Acidimicrobiales bacterium]
MSLPSTAPPVALTIAGTDSGGGAGIAADLRAFSAYGVFGALVVSAVTAQNTLAVRGIQEMSPSFVDAQLAAVLDDLPVAAVKTGMLASAEVVRVVARRAARGELPNLVVDPVMVAASGASLVEGDARAAYLELLAQATVVTPNLDEAEVLVGHDVRDEIEMERAAKELRALGARAVVIKGGHRKDSDAADAVALDDDEVAWLRAPWVDTANVHGTGCTLSAAIAANLALGRGVLEAISEAKSFVREGLVASSHRSLGKGPGPLFALPRTRH